MIPGTLPTSRVAVAGCAAVDGDGGGYHGYEDASENAEDQEFDGAHVGTLAYGFGFGQS